MSNLMRARCHLDKITVNVDGYHNENETTATVARYRHDTVMTKKTATATPTTVTN